MRMDGYTLLLLVFPYLSEDVRNKFVAIVTSTRDCRQGLDWYPDLLTTLPHDSELQVITATQLISTP
jgi:hypothetical protein